MRKITLSQALAGYDLYAAARHLSSNTLADYHNVFRKLAQFLEEDIPFANITVDMIRAFLASRKVSNKTILNYHTGLSALWRWACTEHLVSSNILTQVPRPKPEKRVIEVFTQQDIKLLLGALDQSRVYKRPGKRACSHSLPYAARNKAVILLLLDTGIRVQELCDLQICHFDYRVQRIKVFGKGSKERMVPLSARTAQVIWKYLATRTKTRPEDPLFTTSMGHKFLRSQVLHLFYSIGKRAGVTGVHPHRFRHTFAVTYLRNGGDVFTLQSILGHSSLDMVRKYLQIAQVDLDETHRRASPVDNWRL